MAGVKGRSGGPRKNSGGARPGAGRKKKVVAAETVTAKAEPAVAAPVAEPAAPVPETPLDYLLSVMKDPKADMALRVRAALGAAPYVHGKATELGKKEAREVAAKGIGAGSGRFASARAPKLVAAGGRKV